MSAETEEPHETRVRRKNEAAPWRRRQPLFAATRWKAVARPLVRDPRFQEHLALRYYGERDVANKYRGLLQQAEAVLAQLRKQILRSD
jgi:hypothetical protein